MNIDLIIKKLLEDINVLEAQTEKNKGVLILKAAEDLEKEGFEPSKICARLTKELKNKVSERHVQESLPDKYKQLSKKRTPPMKTTTDGRQEAEKEVVNLKEQKDVKIGHNEEDTTNNFDEVDNKPKQQEPNYLNPQEITPPLPDFKTTEDFIKEDYDKQQTSILEEKDKEIKELRERIDTLEARITDLENIIEEKDKEIFILKGKLVLQGNKPESLNKPQAKQIEIPKRPLIAQPSLFTSKPIHQDYDKGKYDFNKLKKK